MIRWRLILGTLIVTALSVLCWLDAHAARPGIYLLPLTLILTPLAAGEMLGFFRQRGHQPLAWVIYAGTLLPVMASCVPVLWQSYPAECPVGRLGWLACGIGGALLLALWGELRRFDASGAATTNLALASLAILYVGGLMGFLVQLRLLRGEDWASDGRLGLVALLSVVVTVKLSDTFQFVIGKLYGKRQMAPRLSPGKTWEGALGGIATSVVLSSLLISLLLHGKMGWMPHPLGRTMLYTLLIAVAGIVGDLAESMLKRDAGVKDSSNWLPGFGGVLDMLDSLLVAAPVAYFCWVVGLVGP